MRTKLFIGSALAVVLAVAAGASLMARPSVTPEPAKAARCGTEGPPCCPADACCPECPLGCPADGCCDDCVQCCIELGYAPSCCVGATPAKKCEGGCCSK
jgi:hypothetical protein